MFIPETAQYITNDHAVYVLLSLGMGTKSRLVHRYKVIYSERRSVSAQRGEGRAGRSNVVGVRAVFVDTEVGKGSWRSQQRRREVGREGRKERGKELLHLRDFELLTPDLLLDREGRHFES